MKTLVLLSALASIAIAAPALLEDIEASAPIQNSFLNFNNREKKSPFDVTADSLPNTETSNTNLESETSATAVARSFALKKPLIVKNKHGYRLYRDSEEEKAMTDTHQTCGRQIRVKVCDEDARFTDMMRSTAEENMHSSEDDMKHSIQMAKEAVENLQRDLKKMEHNGATKMMPGNSDSEELHEEIEVARQALDHVHKNFGNLESMSLHAKTTKDLESMHDLHLTIAKPEEERMAQWKEAMKNIQKNVEIVRNIEDSFKSVQETNLPIDTSASLQTEHHFKDHVTSHSLSEGNLEMRSTQNMKERIKEKDEEKETLHKMSNDNFDEHHTREENPVENDMNPSASTVNEVQIDNLKNEEALRSDMHGGSDAKKTGSQVIDTTFETLHEPKQENSNINVAEQEIKTKLETETVKNSENILDSLVTPSMVMNTEAPNENEKNAEQKWNNDSFEMTMDQMKGTEDLAPKSVENTKHQTFNEGTEQIKPTPILEQEKAVQKTPEFIENTMMMETSETVPDFQMGDGHRGGTDLQIDNEQNENFMFVKSADHDLQKNHQKIDNLNQHELGHLESLSKTKSLDHTSHLTHETDRLSSMKAAEEFMNEFHDHDRMKHMNFNEHMHGELDASSEFGMSDHAHLHSGNFNHNLMTHGKMVDMRMHPDFHPSMRDNMDGFGSENGLRWQPAHGTARTAYGSGGLPSTGAVGVFPNANAGGCGIPLLLSCSPSVVSGSLAKPHPTTGSGTYPAAAYRTEDDFTFHNKRDIKKTNDILTSNVLRSPMIMKQKNKIMLETKF